MKEICKARQKRQIFTVFLPFLLVGLLTPVSLCAEVIDKVVAVINEEVITLSELDAETPAVLKALTKSNPDRPVQDILEQARERALSGMIEQRLIKQKADKYNVRVSEKDVDKAYEEMRSGMSLEPSEFRQKLSRSGLTEESYRNKLRSQILQSRLLNLDVRSKVVVTDEMIEAYYQEHYTSKVAQGSFYLLQIGCTLQATVSDSGSLEAEKVEVRTKTDRIRKLALSGKDFKMLAEKFSELPSASDGGDIGIFTLDEMAPAMRAVVEKLKPGEISEIIETADGYQFFKLLSADEDSTVATSAFNAVKEEIREKIYDEKLKIAYSEWVKKLKEEAYIQKL